MPASAFPTREVGSYRFVDEGQAASPPVVLLHGMLGDLSNWTATISFLRERGFRVIVPVLPVYDLPLRQTSVQGLVEYVHGFFQAAGIERAVLVGNSLGGHVALMFARTYPEQVVGLILSGASGIYEVNIGASVPRRQDRDYIRERAAITFYSPEHATDELVEEMYRIVNDRARVVRLIQMARATKSESVQEHLEAIFAPTLLVWGRDDVITPIDVGAQFERSLPHARLVVIDECGHAPMLERPDAFNEHVHAFLKELSSGAGKKLNGRSHTLTGSV